MVYFLEFRREILKTIWHSLWIFLLFLLTFSLIQTSNFLGDYDNYISDPFVQKYSQTSLNQIESSLNKSISVLALTVALSILSFLLALGIYYGKETQFSIISKIYGFRRYLIYVIIITYLGRVVAGILLLTDSSKSSFFNLEDTLDAQVKANSQACIVAYPETLVLCRVVYSYHFLYGEEIFFLVCSFISLVPWIIFTQKLEERSQNLIRFINDEMSDQNSQNNMKNNEEEVDKGQFSEERYNHIKFPQDIQSKQRKEQLPDYSLDQSNIKPLQDQSVEYSRIYPAFVDDSLDQDPDATRLGN